MNETTGAAESRRCPWCSTEVSAEMKRCPQCDAALAVRETIGDLVIPGVTHVDPALAQFADDPLRIPGPSQSQYVAGPAMGAAVVLGGPAGLVALGGLAAIAAAEYLGAGGDEAARRTAIERVGQPSEIVLQMIEKLEREEQAVSEASDRSTDEQPPST